MAEKPKSWRIFIFFLNFLALTTLGTLIATAEDGKEMLPYISLVVFTLVVIDGVYIFFEKKRPPHKVEKIVSGKEKVNGKLQETNTTANDLIRNKLSDNQRITSMTRHEFNQKLAEGRTGVIEALDFLSGLIEKHPTLKNRIGYQVNSMLAEAADEDTNWRKLSDRIKVLGIGVKEYFTEETSEK